MSLNRRHAGGRGEGQGEHRGAQRRDPEHDQDHRGVHRRRRGHEPRRRQEGEGRARHAG